MKTALLAVCALALAPTLPHGNGAWTLVPTLPRGNAGCDAPASPALQADLVLFKSQVGLTPRRSPDCNGDAGASHPQFPREIVGTSNGKSVEIRQGDKRIDFLRHGQVVASYHTDASLFKPHFHPILAPNGKPITRRFPMEKVPGETTDHKHHRGAWFCHGDVIPEGLKLKHKVRGVTGVDFWAEGEGHGRIIHQHLGLMFMEDNKDAAGIHFSQQWKTADGEAVLGEGCHLWFFDRGDAYLITFDITLIADEYPLIFGDTKEGCFAVRVADSMTEKNGGVLENAQGRRGEKNCWGRLSAWCDYSGKVDGQTVGIAILADPRNEWHSAWHARSYGLLAANPFGRNKSGFPARLGQRDLVRLAKGEKLHLRYGILVHNGDAKTGKVAEHYEWFSRQPWPRSSPTR